MPIYSYKCENCGDSFDKLQKMSDKQLKKCKKCGKHKLKKQLTCCSLRTNHANGFKL